MTPASTLWLLISLVLWTQVAAGQDVAKRGPVPSWAVHVDIPTPKSNAKSNKERDSQTLLEDVQVQLEAGSHTTYRHVAYALHTSAGVQSLSELSIGRASDAQLTWHFIRVHRAGRVIELLPKLAIKVIQPEARLGAKLYDESRQEVAFLHDVRAGDLIEYAYSLRESDAVLGNAYADRYWLAHREPVLRLHLTVSWPAHRTIHARAVGAKVDVGETGLRYDADDVPGYEVEEREPEWFEATPYLELSEFGDWASVVAWGLARYEQPALEDSLVRAQVETLRQAGDQLAQATQAVRFVQDEIRYLGIEVAEQALVPQPPATVLAQRYGDCKGKTKLLITLLRALGVDAAPALVSTRWRRGIAEQLPAPYAFDHVIAQVTLRGRVLWIDATESLQRRPLMTLTDAPYGRALVLRAGERALRELSVKIPQLPQVAVREVFGLTADNVGRLDVETTYSGARADDMRSRLMRVGQEELQEDALNFYGSTFGQIAVRAPFEWADDPEHDRVIFREHYTLADLHARSTLEVSAWSILDFLPLPSASRAPRPFALQHPIDLQQQIRIQNLPSAGRNQGWFEGRKVDSDTFRYEYNASIPQHGAVELTWTFQSKSDHVPPDGLAKYKADAKRAKDSAGYAVELAEFHPATHVNPWVGYLTLGSLLSFGFYMLVRRTLRHLPQRKRVEREPPAPALALGETAASAIRVKDPAQLERALARIECCRERLFDAPHDEPTIVHYNDEQLAVYKRRCPRCQRMNARYFAASD